MPDQPVIRVIIPALNEEASIGKVLADVPPGLVEEVVVVDNGSTDATVLLAKRAGATVLNEKERGYGYACLRGIDYLQKLKERTDIVVFIDADYSDRPEEMPMLVDPIIDGSVDMVIGSRTRGERQRGSMTPPQLFGNFLATVLIRLIYKKEYTDLGPFRAIDFNKLQQLEMKDKTYGWTVEMQIKAAKKGLRYTEVPVSYRKRIGKSKVSGTIRGVLMAGYKIIWTIFKYI